MLYSHPRFKPTGRLLQLVLAAAMAIFPVGSAAATAPANFEVPGIQKASEVLPPNLVSGPHYKVQDKVVLYGFTRNYVVDSDYGTFRVAGDLALRKLVKEIGAIARLQEIKKGKAYLQGIKNAASQPLEFGANLMTNPVDTVSGIPRGVASLFENVKTGLTTKAGKNEDGKAAQLLTMSANKRELADKLGVDVYSGNKVLQKELNGVAWATSLGSLSVSGAFMAVGGAAVMAVSSVRTAQQLTNVLTQYPPQKLRRLNERKLQAMGIAPDLRSSFLDNQSYTPTQCTLIVMCLENLSGARGRDSFLRYALSAVDEESANFFQYMAEILNGYDSTTSTIKDIKVFGPLVFAKAANGTVITPLPLDYAMWTRRASQRVPDAVRQYRAADRGERKYEFWLTGTAAPLAKAQLAKHGIRAVENVGSRIQFVYY